MQLATFTFHNVSINTKLPEDAKKYDCIYIPQCFY